MASRYAVFVDAGYLVAQAVRLLSSEAGAPVRIRLDHAALVPFFRSWGQSICGGAAELLRVYWYDASPAGNLHPAQVSMAMQAGLKLRLGALNSRGQQKGVDTLLVHDLTTLARNGAIADAVVVSGDDDLRLGLVLSQELGIRVHLLGVEPTSRNTAMSLRMEADGLHELVGEDLLKIMRFEVHANPHHGEDAASSEGMDFANYGIEEVDLGDRFSTPSEHKAVGTEGGPWGKAHAQGEAQRVAFDWEQIRHVSRPSFEELSVLPHPAPMDQVAELVLKAMPEELQAALMGWPGNRPLPQVVDGALMVTGGEVAGQRLGPDAKQALRRAFRIQIHSEQA